MRDVAESLVLLRHGESTANAAGLFTGVLDVRLTDAGRAEARLAGGRLRDAGIRIDALVSSTMLRAMDSAAIVAAELEFMGPLETDWRLDERNYGALTGRSKHAVLETYGRERFQTWRRSLDVAPPAMSTEQYERIVADGRGGTPIPAGLGLTESLADVVARVSEFWQKRALPALWCGETVLVVAHGNSLRALCTLIDELDATAVEALNLPTGQPLLYGIDGRGRGHPRGGQYLDPEPALQSAVAIAQQGGT